MKKRIILSFTLLFFILAAGAVTATVYTTRSTKRLGRLVTLHQIESLRRSLLVSVQTVQADLYGARTPLGHRLDVIVRNVQTLEEAAHDCTSCHHGPEVNEDLRELDSLIHQYKEELSRYITMSANPARVKQAGADAAAVGGAILLKTEEMSLSASGKLNEATQVSMREVNTVMRILLVSIASSFLLGLLVAGLLTRSITKPFGDMIEATRAISAGELDHRVPRAKLPEFDELGQRFNAMGAALRESYGELARANDELQREIGERREAEREIKRAFERTRRILDKAPFGVFVVGVEGRIEYANSAMQGIYGERARPLVGSLVTDHSAYVDIGLPAMVQEAQAGKPFNLFEVDVDMGGDGNSSLHSISGMSFGGSADKALVFVEDMTERAQLESQLRHSQKMEALGTLTGGIAHEFNNIMTVILSCAELLRTKIDDGDPMREFVDVLSTSTLRASELTQGLLVYGRKHASHRERVSLPALLDGIGGLLSKLIDEDIELNLVTEDEDLCIMGDGHQIEQVLMNLVANARDAMPGGGRLQVKLERATVSDEAPVVGCAAGAYARIMVSDSGQGMDDSTRQKVFEPFFTTKEVGRGTGLGLSIVYGIVDKHGGSIHVESKLGEGTSFTVMLPLMVEEGEEPAAVVMEEVRGGDETILLAEDDDAVRAVASRMLSGAGYHVIEASDGVEVLAHFRSARHKVDLVLCDVIMPGKNGAEVCEALRELAPDVRILFMSGYTDDLLAEKGVAALGWRVITKPLTQVQLLRGVREALDMNEAAADDRAATG